MMKMKKRVKSNEAREVPFNEGIKIVHDSSTNNIDLNYSSNNNISLIDEINFDVEDKEETIITQKKSLFQPPYQVDAEPVCKADECNLPVTERTEVPRKPSFKYKIQVNKVEEKEVQNESYYTELSSHVKLRKENRSKTLIITKKINLLQDKFMNKYDRKITQRIRNSIGGGDMKEFELKFNHSEQDHEEEEDDEK